MENIVEKINLILKAKNISARQFAEEIGVQPSGMSHILSGRNNPSLDFVMKVVRRYPEIDIKWLMFGQGEMIVGARPQVAPTPTQVPPATPVANQMTTPVQVASPVQPTSPVPIPTPSQTTQAPAQTTSSAQSVGKKSTSSKTKELSAPSMDLFSQVNENRVIEEPTAPVQEYQNVSEVPQMDISAAMAAATAAAAATHKTKHVVRLLAFYDDHTFAEFLPE